ncbi:MAG: DNA-binding NarL/FixJ family response regulator [Hydrogenophaga sp.]|jgi:DNA-binding NarL/FixJ family response regulator
MPATPAAPSGSLAGDDTRLYLIEDDPLIMQFVRETLVLRPGWRLLGVSPSVAHACEHALSAQADVFLIDLGLPDGRGETVVELLARYRPQAERLVFTMFGEESRLVRALEAGATGYVLKGCSSQELVTAIDQIRSGGAPISPLLARRLLQYFRAQPALASDAAYAGMGDDSAPSEAVEAADLSPREREVLQLLAQGYVNKEVAQRLFIAPATVGSHIKSLYRKLAVNSRVQMVRSAQERGLL